MAATTASAKSAGGLTEVQRVAAERRAIGLLSPVAYDEAVANMVMASAPNLFAVVEYEVAAPEIARVMGYGVSAGEWVHVVSVDGTACGTFETADEALKPYETTNEVAARIVWITPDLVLQKLLVK